jgi:hypothetical protein
MAGAVPIPSIILTRLIVMVAIYNGESRVKNGWAWINFLYLIF